MDKMNNIIQYMNLHGNEYVSNIDLDENIYKVMSEISNIKTIDLNGIDFKYISKKKIKDRSISFFNKFFKLHEVGYLPNNKLKQLFINKNFSNVEKIIDTYNKSALFVSPFKIPISYEYKELFSGTLVTQTLLTDDDKNSNKILSGLNIYFSEIVISSVKTDISTASYIHEITHSQIESNKGLTIAFNNQEVLSIF